MYILYVRSIFIMQMLAMLNQAVEGISFIFQKNARRSVLEAPDIMNKNEAIFLARQGERIVIGRENNTCKVFLLEPTKHIFLLKRSEQPHVIALEWSYWVWFTAGLHIVEGKVHGNH